MGYKVLIKRPDEKIGHMTWISGTLENLQTHVEGLIEAVPVANDPLVLMIVNENGKIIDGMEENFWFGNPETYRDLVYGTVVVCGVDETGEDFSDIPISRQQWKRMLEDWGNNVNE